MYIFVLYPLSTPTKCVYKNRMEREERDKKKSTSTLLNFLFDIEEPFIHVLNIYRCVIQGVVVALLLRLYKSISDRRLIGTENTNTTISLYVIHFVFVYVTMESYPMAMKTVVD